MPSNYKRLGDHIKPVKKKNSESLYSELLGINIDKFFMPSVANIVGVDLAKYKVVKKNQFACNRMHVGRDYRIPVALSQKDEPFIVSPAYDVFEITKPDVLDPEYLMMWFSRSEFDRNAWFHTDGDVRGGLPWEAFCGLELPVPHIDVQRAMVMEYNTITNRIALNEQLNQKLEETAQTLYRHWFVDFEFPYDFEKGKPSLQGQPYKSSGGEMEWCEELEKDVPKRWYAKPFTEAIELGGGGTPKTAIEDYWDGDIPFFTARDMGISYYSSHTIRHITDEGLDNCSSRLYPKNTTFIVSRGATVGSFSLAGLPMAMNQSCYAVQSKENERLYAHQLTIHLLKWLKEQASGSTFNGLVTSDFDQAYVTTPTDDTKMLFHKTVSVIYKSIEQNTVQFEKLNALRRLLLSKMSTVEVGVGGGVVVG